MPRIIVNDQMRAVHVTKHEATREDAEEILRQAARQSLYKDVFSPALSSEGSSSVFTTGGVDRRQLTEIVSAREFETWLSDQALRWKPFLNEAEAGLNRKAEFFKNARDSIALTSMSPDERMKAISVLKSVEQLIDRD